jgi:hypothetical protein
MNSYLKPLALAAVALAAAYVFAAPTILQGDDWNLKTYITVSHEFQVPGAVLQPNTKYVLRRLDGNAGTNHIVRILNAEENEVMATFHAVSDYRLEPTDNTVLTFMETAAGYPKPVKSWFYPGRTDGLEFIYSKEEKAEIAQHMQGAQPAEVQTARVEESEAIVPETEETPLAQEPAVDEPTQTQDMDNDVQREKPADAEAPVTAEEPSSPTTEESLPATAGELPLIGLLGLACLGLRKTLRSYLS